MTEKALSFENREGMKTPAANERFCESGGVCPPELLC